MSRKTKALKDMTRILAESEQKRKAEPFLATCSVQGNIAEYRVTHRAIRPVGGKRGEITEFSRSARLRMLKEFHRIDFSLKTKPLFVTLTYPDPLSTPDLDERNKHRKLFARHLEKYLGQEVAAAWRVEWVPRKSGVMIGQPCPHWHLLIFRIGYIPYEDINRLWRLAIGWDGYCRTDIRRVDESGAIQLYMAKYIAKDALSLSLVIAAYQNKVGRSYGWLRKAKIPRHPLTRHNALSDAQRAALVEMASERLPLVSDDYETSFTLLGQAVRDVEQILADPALTDT